MYISTTQTTMTPFNSSQENWEQALLNVRDALESPTPFSQAYEPDAPASAFTPLPTPLQRAETAPEAPTAPNRQDDPEWGLKYLAGLAEVLKAREDYHAKLLKFYNFESRFDPNACVCELWRRAHESFHDIAVDMDTVVYNSKT